MKRLGTQDHEKSLDHVFGMCVHTCVHICSQFPAMAISFLECGENGLHLLSDARKLMGGDNNTTF